MDREHQPDQLLEHDLQAAFAFAMPPWFEARVCSGVAARLASDRGSSAPAGVPTRSRTWTRALAVTAGLVVIAGACAIVIDQLDPFGATGRVEFDRGTPFGARTSANGWQVTLERAYADANELTLFLIVKGPDDGAAPSAVQASDVTVTDGRGRELPRGGSGHHAPGGGTRGDDESAHVLRFDPPAGGFTAGGQTFVARVHTLGLKFDDDTVSTHLPLADSQTDSGTSVWRSIDGPWDLEFQLAADGGTVVTPGIAATVDGVTLTLESLSTTASMLRAIVTIDGAPAGVEWMPSLLIERDGETWEAHSTSASEVDGVRTATVEYHGGGFDDPDGHWQIEVPAIVAYHPVEDRITARLDGPWDLSFDALDTVAP